MTRAGVSILEVLLAAGILAFGLVPIMGSIQASTREARLLEFQTQALARARGCLEAARVLGPPAFDALLADKAVAVVPVALPSAAGTEASVLSLMEVTETVTVRLVERHGGAGFYLLKCRVDWRLRAEERLTHTVELTTALASPLTSINDPGGGP